MPDSSKVTVSRSANALSIQMPGDGSYLAHIREFIVDLARRIGFPEEEIARIEMSVDEACANVVEHAYSEGKQWRWQHRDPEIRLSIQAAEDQLVIEINDHGQHFDLAAYQPTDIQARAHDMQTGGYGIAIIRQFMDEVSYSSSDASGNTLRLVKYLKKP